MAAIDAGDVVWTIGADLRQVNAAMVRAEQEFTKSFGAITQSTGRAVQRVGYAVTAAGVAVTGAFGYAVKAAVEWEDAFTGVRKTVDATEEQFAELAAGIRQMATEIPVAATDLASFAEIGGQMGVPREQLLAFAKVIAILAETTNIAGEEGAAMLAQFANVAQVPQSQYSNLAASIVALGNAGTSTEAEILAMGQRLAAAGSISGMTAGDILGLSNALVGVGIEAEAGGTALSKVMIDMKNSVMSGGKQLEMLAQVAGMSAQEFARAFNEDPAQAIVSFIQGLARVQEQGGNVFAVLDELGYTEIRLRNALLSSAQAADGLADSVRLGNTAFAENNAHLTEAEKRFATTSNQWKLLKNNVTDVAISLGDVLIPVLRDVFNELKPYLEQLRAWIAAHPEATETIVKLAAAFGAFMAVMGPIIVVIGSFIAGIGGIVATVAAISAGTITAPFIAIGAAIVAAIGLIIYYGWYMYQNWEQISGALSYAWGLISDAFWFVFGPIIDAMKWIANVGIGALNSVGGAFGMGQIPQFADGGTMKQAGMALVGERGPELVSLPRGAQVHDANESQTMAGATTNVTLNFGAGSVRSDDDIRVIERAVTRVVENSLRGRGLAYI